MASTKKSTAKPTGTKKPAPKATASTAVRHSAIPKAETFAAPAAAPAPAAAARSVTGDMIARRAYEIWSSGFGGSDQDNWFRAEQELRAA